MARIRRWTKEMLIESARRFRTKGEWRKGDSKAYHICRARNWLSDADIVGHMVAARESWDKPKLAKAARRFHTRNEWQKGDRNSYQACLRQGLLDDPDITGHMVAGDKATDNDAVYLYRFEVARVVLYKVGLTSLSRGTERICRTMWKAGTTAHDVHIWPVDDARGTERKLLELGQPQNVYKGDGYTEMRVFTPEEVRQAVALAEADSTGPAILFENL